MILPNIRRDYQRTNYINMYYKRGYNLYSGEFFFKWSSIKVFRIIIIIYQLYYRFVIQVYLSTLEKKKLLTYFF